MSSYYILDLYLVVIMSYPPRIVSVINSKVGSTLEGRQLTSKRLCSLSNVLGTLLLDLGQTSPVVDNHVSSTSSLSLTRLSWGRGRGRV